MALVSFNSSLRVQAYVLLIVVSCLHLGNALERKITSQLNPDCDFPQCNSSHYSVVYVKAEGPNDTLHYVWDFTGKPAVLLALTSKESDFSISWPDFINGSKDSITFSEPPKYSFGLIIDKVWEFNDINDTGVFDPDHASPSSVNHLDTRYFNWNRIEFKEFKKSTVFIAEADGYNDSSVVKNGTLRVEVQGFGFNDHSELLPHLLHTPNTTQIDMVFDKITTDPEFNSSRFAIEFHVVSQDKANGSMFIDVRKSLDDEHTPGVFTLVDVASPSSKSFSSGGYLQWKPVAYLAQERDINNSTVTNINPVTDVDSPLILLNGTLLYAYYGDNLSSSDILVQDVIVSFGESEDGFYKKTRYTSWTFAVGYGTPPNEDFSLLVILVISIGLGLPALLVVISGLVMSIRRISRKKDDLFLSS